MFQEIYIIEDNLSVTDILKRLFKEEKEYIFKGIKTEQMELALTEIPSLIIINEDTITRDIISVCEQIRMDDNNSITPIIVITSNREHEHKVEILRQSVEYYIKAPIDEEYIYYTIKNIVRLMHMNRRVSPLTGLPGNVQIQAELKKRILKKDEFAVLYFDLDNFKAYNDTYGFLRGDEVIKFTAKVITKNIHNSDGMSTFIGHIGGDDFVGIVPKEEYEKICQNIILEFDEGILKYLNEEDKERGYIEVANRKGVIEEFPLVSLSIGVVEIDRGRFHNILEIGEVGAQVKHVAKTTMGSTYAVNRRKNKVG